MPNRNPNHTENLERGVGAEAGGKGSHLVSTFWPKTVNKYITCHQGNTN